MSARASRDLKEECAYLVQVGGDQPNMMGRFLSVKVFELNRFDGALGELLPRQEIVR